MYKALNTFRVYKRTPLKQLLICYSIQLASHNRCKLIISPKAVHLALVPVAPVPIAPVPVAPVLVAHVPVIPFPIAPVPVASVPVAPVLVAPVPVVAPVHVAPVLVAPVPGAPFIDVFFTCFIYSKPCHPFYFLSSAESPVIFLNMLSILHNYVQPFYTFGSAEYIVDIIVEIVKAKKRRAKTLSNPV